jgi:hypothetical protein
MSTVVTIGGRPPGRADATPWTQARLREAPARSGPWTVIETLNLDPVDADPSTPTWRDFTSEATTLAAGWYQLEWADADGDSELEEPQLIGPAFMPAHADVARVLRNLLRDDLGNRLTAFSASTTPTATEVDDYIADAADHLVSRVGDVPTRHRRAANHVCALRAGILALQGLGARAQAGAGYKDLQALYTDELNALLAALGEPTTGSGDSGITAPKRYGSIATPTLLTPPS